MTQVTIAGYEIVRQVGGDAASTLYKARRTVSQEGTEHRVLLRIFNRPVSPARYDQSLQWAMKAAAPLSNPAVLHIVDWGSTEDEKPYLVMEHAIGHTLAAYFRDDDRATAPQEPQATLTLVYHLALILEDALDLGIVHRDLQPDQILLTPPGADQSHEAPVALMGLDLPYILATLGHDEDAQQTRYLSPEQKQGEALDGRSNVYSLSMLLYDLLGGEAARAASPDALPPLDTLAPHLSQATQRLVRRGLQSKLWKRYHNYSHFTEALQEAIVAEGGSIEALPAARGKADEPVEAAPEAPPAVPPALRIALAQVGLLVLLLVGSFLLLRNGGRQETDASGVPPAESAPSGLFTGIQWTATPSPTATTTVTVAATVVATSTTTPILPPTASATPSPSAIPTEPTATVTPSPSPTVAPTMTDTPVPPPPPTATPVPPTATSQPPPPPPTATSEPPPPPPPPTSTSAPPPPTIAPTATESAPTPTPPSPEGNAAPHLSPGSPQGV